MQKQYEKGPSKGNVQAKHLAAKKVWQKQAQANETNDVHVPTHLNKNEPQVTETQSQQNSPERWKQVKGKSAANKGGVMEVSVAGTNNGYDPLDGNALQAMILAAFEARGVGA